MALKYNVVETNTLARLESLQENQNVPSGLCAEIIEAYGGMFAVLEQAALDPKAFKKEAGKHFDPRLVNTFVHSLPKIQEIYESNRVIQDFITEYKILQHKMDRK